MISYNTLFEKLDEAPFKKWLEILPAQIDQLLINSNNGNLKKWEKAIENLPDLTADNICLNSNSVTATSKIKISPADTQQLETQLRELMPWRKGPYQLFDTFIDTEWHSDWKWDRVIPHLSPLKNKTVLDVGCGNGYHSWRMLGEGADLVIGIDPSLLFIAQYQAIKKYIGEEKSVYVLPLKLEDVPMNLQGFDTVFSMGVLYHRRSPFDHLIHLLSLLKPGGELVLETLIIDGKEHEALVPEDRYAMMNNVWFLPSIPTLTHWLNRCGFQNIRVVDVNQTSTEEQRKTDWMTFNSLADFLHPDDHNLTIEGYPAPKRAVFVASKSEL
ncbi:MAG: tRNA 5-methoxyuridine(34)/uridine 5-oxyacetic acid(34) synthase CmoB [Gammaproteobacteria bacterium]|nr:tRNA 5-methoxyuridine(34)/uridine 5-oxyacetic acid(34) synthase CmoB [Gammaproteobacteria bacterium]